MVQISFVVSGMGKARTTKDKADWLVFRQLCKTCQLRKSKANYFRAQTTKNLNNPTKFWKIINNLSEYSHSLEFIPCVLNDLPPTPHPKEITEKVEMLDCFNEVFKNSETIFDLRHLTQSPSTLSSDCPALKNDQFSFSPVCVSEET